MLLYLGDLFVSLFVFFDCMHFFLHLVCCVIVYLLLQYFLIIIVPLFLLNFAE